MKSMNERRNGIDAAIDWDSLLHKSASTGAMTSSAKVITGSNTKNYLIDTDDNDVLYGYGGNDDIIADWGNDTLHGGAGHDTLDGGFGRDVLYGESGNDVLRGLEGSDRLFGGAGRDTMEGGSGSDIFVFNAALNTRTNVDSLPDFKTADTIQLENRIFTKLTKTGTLSSSAFWTGSAAHDANDRIIYDKSTGNLYYDQDGTGSKNAVLFAKLDQGLALTSRDFYVI
jgi:Ca2+-binding RTX toxin-like protein